MADSSSSRPRRAVPVTRQQAPPRPRPVRPRTSSSRTGGVPAHMRENAVNNGLNARFHVREAERATQLFIAGRFEDCLGMCASVLNETTDAIAARTHMLLATPELHAIHGFTKTYHLEAAIAAWDKVITRKGTSRLPVDQARDGRAQAIAMYSDALCTEIQGMVKEVRAMVKEVRAMVKEAQGEM